MFLLTKQQEHFMPVLGHYWGWWHGVTNLVWFHSRFVKRQFINSCNLALAQLQHFWEAFWCPWGFPISFWGWQEQMMWYRATVLLDVQNLHTFKSDDWFRKSHWRWRWLLPWKRMCVTRDNQLVKGSSLVAFWFAHSWGHDSLTWWIWWTSPLTPSILAIIPTAM